MAHRYRMYPTPAQKAVMETHCGHARFVWNLALEQCRHARRVGQHADQAVWDRQLVEARKAAPWLAAGSSSVQQGALRDLRQAFRNWWGNPAHFRAPSWRKAGVNEGFRVRDLTVVKVSRKWATVHVPKAGQVRFRLTRPVPVEAKSARVTLDRAGRWHVSFVSVPPQVEGPGTGGVVGVDRGVVAPFACSDGTVYEVGGLTPAEKARKRRLQRRLARQQKGSARRARTKAALARLAAREADRRRDSIEKSTTDLARRFDVIRVEDLKVRSMMASARGTVEAPGRNVRAKAGLNRSIAERAWSLWLRRLEDKAPGRVEKIEAAYTSQRCAGCGHTESGNRESQAVFRCRACGHQANADVNAAVNIAAGRAVSGRGGTRHERPCEASSPRAA